MSPTWQNNTHILDLHSHVQYYGSTFLMPSYFLQFASHPP